MPSARLKMHLSYRNRIITCIGQQLRKRREIVRDHLGITFKIVVVKSVIPGRQACDDLVPGRHTDGIAGKCIGIAAAFRSQQI